MASSALKDKALARGLIALEKENGREGGRGGGGDDTCSSRINNMGYKVGRMINEFRQEFRRKKRSWSKPEFLLSHGDLRPKKSTPI